MPANPTLRIVEMRRRFGKVAHPSLGVTMEPFVIDIDDFVGWRAVLRFMAVRATRMPRSEYVAAKLSLKHPRVGDTIDVHLKSRSTVQFTMIHSVDVTQRQDRAVVLRHCKDDPGQEKSMSRKALVPGLYVYRCATPMVAEHIAKGLTPISIMVR